MNAVDTYIQKHDEQIQALLNRIRTAIKSAVPDADEVIGYGIPSYKLNNRYVLHFGAGKNHIGFYATPDGHSEFEKDLAKYKRGKGSVQFPLDQPIPIDLIKRMAVYRAEQCREMLPEIGKPAKNALASIGVTKNSQLGEYTENDLLQLHGVGPKAVRLLREAKVKLKER